MEKWREHWTAYERLCVSAPATPDISVSTTPQSPKDCWENWLKAHRQSLSSSKTTWPQLAIQVHWVPGRRTWTDQADNEKLEEEKKSLEKDKEALAAQVERLKAEVKKESRRGSLSLGGLPCNTWPTESPGLILPR
jgi:hypothetical protein